MRPETAKRKINTVLWTYMIVNEDSKTSLENIIKKLKTIEPELTSMYKKSLRHNRDYRSGEETYGYENIRSDLVYISDRWNCSFRIRWLLDLIKRKDNV